MTVQHKVQVIVLLMLIFGYCIPGLIIAVRDVFRVYKDEGDEEC